MVYGSRGSQFAWYPRRTEGCSSYGFRGSEICSRGSKLSLHKDGESGNVIVEVQSARSHKNVYIVKLKGYENINEVEKFKGCLMKVSADREPLSQGEFYYSDIIGSETVTEEGESLGIITEISPSVG